MKVCGCLKHPHIFCTIFPLEVPHLLGVEGQPYGASDALTIWWHSAVLTLNFFTVINILQKIIIIIKKEALGNVFVQKSLFLRDCIHAVPLCLHCYCGIPASPSAFKAEVCFSIAALHLTFP